MKYIIILLILLIPTQSLAEDKSWDNWEKGLAGGLVVVNGLDYYTTSQFDKHGICELNPLFRERDCSPDIDDLLLGKLVGVSSVLLLGHYSPKSRKVLFGTGIVLTGTVVFINFNLIY